jgi:hypothetical protein
MVVVVLALDVGAVGHDEDAAVGSDHLDRGTIEPCQGLRVDHLVEGPERGVAMAGIKDAVDRAEELVQFMGVKRTVSEPAGRGRGRRRSPAGAGRG